MDILVICICKFELRGNRSDMTLPFESYVQNSGVQHAIMENMEVFYITEDEEAFTKTRK